MLENVYLATGQAIVGLPSAGHWTSFEILNIAALSFLSNLHEI